MTGAEDTVGTDWAGPLCARYDAVWQRARDLDDEHGAPHRLALARDACRAVEAEWGDVGEDDGPEQLGGFVAALEAAVEDAWCTYDLAAPCRGVRLYG